MRNAYLEEHKFNYEKISFMKAQNDKNLRVQMNAVESA